MALPARVWTAGKVLLLVGALAATFMVFAVLAARVAVRARDVAVPNLVGQSLADATATANSLELQMNVEELRRPDAAGARRPRARAGASGRIAVPPAAQRPGVAEQRSTHRARAGAGRRVAAGRRDSDRRRTVCCRGRSPRFDRRCYPPDVVVAQDPSPGIETSEVRLLVNRGEDRASYVMPDLIGVNGDQRGGPASRARASASRSPRRRRLRACRPAS